MAGRQDKTGAEVAALVSNNLFKHDDSQLSQGIKMGEPQICASKYTEKC